MSNFSNLHAVPTAAAHKLFNYCAELLPHRGAVALLLWLAPSRDQSLNNPTPGKGVRGVGGAHSPGACIYSNTPYTKLRTSLLRSLRESVRSGCAGSLGFSTSLTLPPRHTANPLRP